MNEGKSTVPSNIEHLKHLTKMETIPETEDEFKDDNPLETPITGASKPDIPYIMPTPPPSMFGGESTTSTYASEVTENHKDWLAKTEEVQRMHDNFFKTHKSSFPKNRPQLLKALEKIK